MKSKLHFLIAALVCLSALLPTSPAEAIKPLNSAVQIEFPIGDISIRYVESSEGMVLLAKSGAVTVRAKRLQFGDGKRAVTYEATQGGLQTPGGKVNAAKLQLKNGARITAARDELKPWGRQAGEVYILVPNLKLALAKE